MSDIKLSSKLFLFFVLFLFTLPTTIQAHSKQCFNNKNFMIGTGIYDITGPAAERGMMGYALLNQKTNGILQRDWARAFIIKSPCNGHEMVFVNTDLAMLFQGIQQEVLQQLKALYGNEYTAQNVIISAIHQHSGPGGYSLHALYNLSTMGFDKKNFNTICDGIVQSIVRARANMQAATIKIARGALLNASVNRSPTAYLLDSQKERSKYRYNRDTTMTLLRFDNLKGQPIGTINWFPVHGTSLDNQNHLISGDNKGYAAYLFEKDYGSHHGPSAFVAAFAQSNAGDISPNLAGKGGDHGAKGRADVEDIGGKQYREAKKLFNTANIEIKGGIEYRQQYVAMGHEVVDKRFTDHSHCHTTCPAAIGESMLAGTTDGAGFGEQGITSCKGVHTILPKIMCYTLTQKTACQGVKPIILETNSEKPAWTPKVLPFSIVTIGDLAIIANPFELTTMSGRRVRNLVSKDLKPMGIKYVVIAGYSNAYSGYVTTPEEYKAQRYEGASNLFGPRSLGEQMEVYDILSHALVTNGPAPESAALPDMLSWPQSNLQTGVLFDKPPFGKHFGDVDIEPQQQYYPGQTVTVTFFGGHPKNDYHTMGSFLAVEQKIKGQWVTVATDNDWDTTYRWQRYGIAASIITIEWRIPTEQIPGTYRIEHFGDAKSISGHIEPYIGISNSFRVG